MKILIVGGGVAGPALANLLASKHDIEIYERDDGPEARGQGHSFSIRNDKPMEGRKALETIGVWDECIHKYGSPILGFSLLTTKGTKIAHFRLQEGEESASVSCRIHRPELRKCLLDKLSSHKNVTVHYGSKVVGYKNVDNGVELLLQGKVVRGDILIGADGINSVIRQQLIGPNDVLHKSGIIAWMGMCRPSFTDPLINKGLVFTGGSGGSLFIANYRYQGEYWVNWGIVIEESLEVFEEVRVHNSYKGSKKGSPEIKTTLLNFLQDKDWLPLMTKLVQETDPSTIALWPGCDRSTTEHWRDGRVLLIGDAAHPTTPFAGAGANMALMDTLTLSEELDKVQPGADPTPAMDIFIKKRAPMANKFIRQARKNGDAIVHGGWKLYLTFFLPFYIFGRILSFKLMPMKKKVAYVAIAAGAVCGAVALFFGARNQ